MRDEAIADLWRGAERITLTAGECLFRKGDRSEGGYLVVSGCVELTGSSSASASHFVYPGSLIGELSLLAETERSSDAIAHERSDLRKIRRSEVMRVLRIDPVSATNVRTYIEARASELSRSLQSFLPVGR